MKNFKKILAVVLAVLCAVPAMAFTASAETTLADYWYAAGTNVVSALDPALAPYDNTVSITANDDGSVSVRDVAVDFQGAYSNDPITAVTAVYPMELNGSGATIVPVGYDVDGDGENEYASSYSFYFTNGVNNYDEGKSYAKGYGYPNNNGFYTGTTVAGIEYTYGVAIGDNVADPSWAPGFFSANVNDNGMAEYASMTIINSGNYWTCDLIVLETPIDLSQKLSVEIFSNTDLDEDGAVDIGLILNAYDEEKIQYVFGTCADCYADFDAPGAFYLTLGASANGVNTHTASFDIVEVNGETDVANFSNVYCKADAHAWPEWDETNATPTCTEDGTKTRACTTCALSQTEVVAVATGHAYGDLVGTEPTCTEEGVKVKTCANCGDEVEAVTAALGHDYSVMHWLTTPTADVAGTARPSCSRCGDIQDEIVSATASFDLSWTTAAHNVVSNLNPDWAMFDNMAIFEANDDGSVTAKDIGVNMDGAWCYEPVTSITSNFTDELSGFDVTIQPIVGASGGDLNGDGDADYASTYSIFYSTTMNYADAEYIQSNAYPNFQGPYVGTPTAGEYSYGIVFNDHQGSPSWVPDYWSASVEGNNAAEYINMVIISGGNYWTADTIALDIPVSFADQLKVEPFINVDLDEDAVNDIGVILNDYDDNKIQYIFGTCANAFEAVEGKGAFHVTIGAYGIGVNQANASFKVLSIQDSTNVATFSGVGATVTQPTVECVNDDVVITNGQYIKDIWVISGKGYKSYAEIKAAKADAEFVDRSTYKKLDANYSFTQDLASFKEYTVLVRLIDGTEFATDIETGNTDPERASVSTRDSDLRVKFESDHEIRVIRYAPVAGLTTVKDLKNAEGYTVVRRTNFKAIDSSASLIGYEIIDETTGDVTGVEEIDSVRLFPGVAATYSYVVEYADGVKEFGEFTLEGDWSEPTITSTGLYGMKEDRFIRARYAPGEWATEAEVKAAPGARNILKAYTVIDANDSGSRNYEFKNELSGVYTFAIVWGKATNKAEIYVVDFDVIAE